MAAHHVNVLHRVHAENWREPTLEHHPDERRRIAAITRAVVSQLATYARVHCLQEVSGDQLRSLREHLPSDTAVFHHRYPRLPRLRTNGPPPLDDPSEHLVTLVRGPGARQVAEHTFATDAGKGFLGVDLGDGGVVWNAHITFGERGLEQLRALLAAARSYAGTAALMGDFNAPASAVADALGPDVTLADLSAQPPTRVAVPGKDGSWIDHLAALHGRVEDARVLDGAGLSDHHPVAGRVVPAA